MSDLPNFKDILAAAALPGGLKENEPGASTATGASLLFGDDTPERRMRQATRQAAHFLALHGFHRGDALTVERAAALMAAYTADVWGRAMDAMKMAQDLLNSTPSAIIADAKEKAGL
jgi:hypothetical protein